MENSFDKIHQLIDWKKYDLAIQELNNHLSQNPEDAYAMGLLANIYYLKNAFKKSIHWGEQSLALDQNHPFVFVVLSDALTSTRKTKKAQQIIDQGLSLFPDEPNIFLMKGELELKELRYASALEYAEKGLSLAPNNTMLLNLKASILEKKDPALAEKILNESLSIDPENSDTFSEKAWLELYKGNYSKAEEFFLEALHIDPENKDATLGHLWTLKTEEFPNVVKALLFMRKKKAILGIITIAFVLGLFLFTVISKIMGSGSWLLFFLVFYGFLLLMRIIAFLDATTTIYLAEELKSKKYISHKLVGKSLIKLIRFCFILFVFIILLAIYFW